MSHAHNVLIVHRLINMYTHRIDDDVDDDVDDDEAVDESAGHQQQQRTTSSIYSRMFGADGVRGWRYEDIYDQVRDAVDPTDDIDTIANALAPLVGGHQVLESLPRRGRLPAASLLVVAKGIAGCTSRVDRANKPKDLMPLFGYVSTDLNDTKTYTFLSSPNPATDAHTLLTMSLVANCIAPELLARHNGNHAAVWHEVFSGEIDRITVLNCRGGRLIPHCTATTNGTRCSFQYANMSRLQRCAADTALQRGVKAAVFYNDLSYKSLLPDAVQRPLHAAEQIITHLRTKVRLVYLLCVCC